MRQLFESVLELRGIQERFHSQSECELKRRRDLEKYIEIHGTCNEIEDNDADTRERFTLEVGRYENIIKEISNSFKASIYIVILYSTFKRQSFYLNGFFFFQFDLGKFLKKLIKVSTDDQEALHSLANRINFNHFYSKNDQELEKCATYLCRPQK